jgi:ammonia channel protein AmtB
LAGTLGAFLTGLLATAAVNPNLSAISAQRNGLAQIVGHLLWLEQLKAIGITIALALVGTSLIGLIVRATIGLRITPEIERQGRYRLQRRLYCFGSRYEHERCTRAKSKAILFLGMTAVTFASSARDLDEN